MKRTSNAKPSRRVPVFPFLIIICLLGMLCVLIFTLTQPKAFASNIPSEGGIPAVPQDDGAPVPETADRWELELVNFSHPLREGYVPELSSIDSNGEQFDSRAAGALQDMLDGMRAQGLSPLVCSAHRSHELQTDLFQSQVQGWLDEGYPQEEAESRAAQLVARPGTSEHELGLAADIVAESNQLLDESQEATEEQQWLMEHCQEYGFILRYPPEKTSLTGVEYEPWHYRYVGKTAANEIMENGLCLEEYLGLE